MIYFIITFLLTIAAILVFTCLKMTVENAFYPRHPYLFKGLADEIVPFYKHHTIYWLDVRTGWNGKPYIRAPHYCPYDSWELFYQNWASILQEQICAANDQKNLSRK